MAFDFNTVTKDDNIINDYKFYIIDVTITFLRFLYPEESLKFNGIFKLLKEKYFYIQSYHVDNTGHLNFRLKLTDGEKLIMILEDIRTDTRVVWRYPYCRIDVRNLSDTNLIFREFDYIKIMNKFCTEKMGVHFYNFNISLLKDVYNNGIDRNIFFYSGIIKQYQINVDTNHYIQEYTHDCTVEEFIIK